MKKTTKTCKQTCKHKNVKYNHWYTPNGNTYESVDCLDCGKTIINRGPYEEPLEGYK